MKHARNLTLALTAVVAAGSAAGNPQLAQKNGCMVCHAVDKKVLGPAYRDVAKKYAGQPDAVAKLIESIRKGGAGKWGPVPMPPQTTLSDADTKALAAWILSGAK